LGLRPLGSKSSWDYEWSLGRKRAWIDLHGTLPADALKDYDNIHTSNCTYEHVDIRLLGGIYITIIELMSVRANTSHEHNNDEMLIEI
jgi:hypothetical protein